MGRRRYTMNFFRNTFPFLIGQGIPFVGQQIIGRTYRCYYSLLSSSSEIREQGLPVGLILFVSLEQARGSTKIGTTT